MYRYVCVDSCLIIFLLFPVPLLPLSLPTYPSPKRKRNVGSNKEEEEEEDITKDSHPPIHPPTYPPTLFSFIPPPSGSAGP